MNVPEAWKPRKEKEKGKKEDYEVESSREKSTLYLSSQVPPAKAQPELREGIKSEY